MDSVIKKNKQENRKKMNNLVSFFVIDLSIVPYNFFEEKKNLNLRTYLFFL